MYNMYTLLLNYLRRTEGVGPADTTGSIPRSGIWNITGKIEKKWFPYTIQHAAGMPTTILFSVARV